MPINKFNGYYYGVGLKLDEKSVNDFSKQLENKLNKTVANVTKEITSLQEALKLGKDADLTPLIASLNAAVTGIKGVNDADFNVLRAQVEDMDNKFKGLTQTVEKLGVDLTDVSQKFDTVIGNLSTKIDRFLSQPSTMRDSLKHDLRAMQDMAKYYSEALKLDPNTKATGLEAYFAEFKNQFGNISELSDVATQEIAQDFLRLGDLLRKSGLPIEGIRSDLLQMTTQLEAAFKLKNPAGAEKLFQSIGYQVDASEAKLVGLQKQMRELEKESERLSSMLDKSGNVKFNGGTLAKEDQILNLEEKIEKVKHYVKQVQELDEGSVEWVNTFKNSISLVRSVEKEIAKIKAPDDKLVVEWGKFLQGFNLDVGETLGASLISDFSTQIRYAIEDIADQRQNLEVESKKLTQSIAELVGTQRKLNDVKTTKPSAKQVKGQIQEQYKLNLSEEVNLKVKIDNEAWRKAINASITKIEQKIVPIKIKAELKDAEKVKGEITKLKNAQLMTDGTKKKGKDAGADKDAETFNKRFDNLLKTINGKKKELNEALTSWHKEFDKMFEFQFKVNGLKKDEYGNLSTVIANLVDSINTTLEDKPLKFTSNIEELAAKIQEQLQNIKIDNLQVGGISAGSIGAGGITSTGGIPMFPMQIIPAINGAGQAAQGAAEGFKQAGQAAEEAGQKAKSGTSKSIKAEEERLKGLLAAYSKLTEKQKQSIYRKNPNLAKAFDDMLPGKKGEPSRVAPTYGNYQNTILRFRDLDKFINDVRPNNGIQQFIDRIQSDISEYIKLDDDGKKASSRSNSYVESIVNEYFHQVSKKGKANEALASNKELFNIFAQLKATPTYENYKNLILDNTGLGNNKESIFSTLEGFRPTGKVQDFIKLLADDQKAYIAAFGKPVVESAATQQNRQWFENGKQIVEYIIQLAQMAAKINPLRSKTGVEITKDLFGDGDLSRWISGRQVSVEDIGTIIGKKDVVNSDVDKFLSDMGMTRQNLVGKSDPYTAQYLNPLLTAINNFKEKQATLDKALAQLQSDKPTKNMQKFIEGFGAAESKESYLSDNLKWLQTIAKKGATTDAQKYIIDTFKNNNVDISTLKSAKTQAEQWQIIQDQILNNPNVDFNKLMGDLRAGKDNFHSSYKDFVEIIGIAKRFVTRSNALADIGKVANSIVEGAEETITRADGTEKKIKVNGLRSELNKYGVVITGQDGTSFGYRAGQETVENGLFGNKNAFTQIANQLASALQNAVDIAFTKNKIGDLDVKQYRATTSAPKATYTQDLYFNRDLALQRRDYYQQEINKLNARLQRQESNYNALSSKDGFNAQLGKNLRKNKRFVELETKMKAETASLEEKVEFTNLTAQAIKELEAQKERLANTIQTTKNELNNLAEKLKQSKKDYTGFNSQIRKQEKAFKQGTYQPAQTPKQQPASGSSSQPAPSGGTGFYAPGGVSGGFVVGGSADIARESTVRAIYNALVGNNGGDNPQLNSRIEALEKAIAAEEAALKAQKKTDEKPKQKKEQQKKDDGSKKQDKPKADEDKKKAEEARKKAEAEARKAEEEKRKAEAEKKKAEEEARKKAEEAEKKKAEEERIRAEAEKKKAEEAARKAENQKKLAEESARKAAEEEKKKDPIQKSVGKTEKELFAASNKYFEEVNSFMQIFREHQFAIVDGKVSSVKSGLLAQVGGIPNNYRADTRGHMHPENSLYSGQDIRNIARRKTANNRYDKDLLITPDNVFSMSGLKNKSAQIIDNLGVELETLENALRRLNLSDDSFRKFETALKFTALSDAGVNFKAYSKNTDGSLTDITDQFTKVSSELYKNFIKIGMADLSKGLPAQTIQAIKESSEFKSIDSRPYISGEHIPNSLNRIISVIQNAIDNKLDLNPLNTVKGQYGTAFEVFMRELEGLENFIAKDSPYYEIKSKFKSNGNDANFMNSIRPLLEQFFKVGDNKERDKRADGLYNQLYGVNKPQSGQTDKSIDQSAENYNSLADMKAELAFLKSIQSGSGVQFATQAKQDQIISILQGGIKVKGVDGKDVKDPSGDKEKKQEKNLPTSEQAKQAQQVIGSMSKEASVKIDSTGKQTIHTIQKIGAETAKVTQVTEDGVTKSTLELSNKYETAMKSLFQKIRGDSGKYLFGAETVRFGVETTEAQDTLLKYVDTYRQLEDAMEQYKKSGDILLTDGPNQGKQLQTVIDELQVQLGEYEKRLISISNASQSFLGDKAPFAMLDGTQLKDSANSLKLLATSTEPLGVAFNGLYNDGKRLMYDVLDNGVIKRYALEVDAATGNVRKMEVSQTALVNALQNVNKAAKQGEALKSIFINDDVNQSATVIQNYKNAYKEMNDYVRQAWDTARANGGLIPIDEQEKIYAMSQEVLRLGATIQKEYKRIATIRDSGTPFELFGQIGGAEEVETKIRQYLNRFAEGQTLQVSNLQYDSVTQSMTADLVDLYGTITKVKLEYNELLNSVNVSSAKGTNSIDDMSTKMVNIGNNIDQALGAGVINKNLDEYKAYAAEVAKLDELIANIENGTIAYNVDAIQQWNAQRQAVIDTGKALSEVAQINAKKSLPGVRAVEAQSNKKIKIDNMIETIPGAQDSEKYQAYITAYEKLLTLRERFRTEGTLGLESNQKQLQVESDKVNQLANSLSKLLQESAKIRASASDEDILKLPNSFDVQNLEAEMKKFAGISSDATKEQWKFNNATSSASYVIKGADNVVSEMTVSYDALTNSIVRTTNQQYKVKTALQEFADSVGNKFKELGRYLLSFGSFYQIWGVIRQGVTYVRDIDSALTELKKVTNETDASYDRFLQNMSKTGSVIGATVSNLTTIAAEWSRLGYTMEEAGRLAESTAILLNVSEFEDATTASEALISTMQAFQYTADESQHVVDVLNEVGNNYAISSDGLAVALQDSASALMEAGNTLEQSVALVASANKVVQDPNSVGSALRTISLRLRGTSVSVLEEMGEETDGVVESVSKMQKKIKALTGVDILTDSGAYKETYTILREIGTVWEDMSDIDQAALLELMAGKNRANTLAALLGNMEDLEGAYKDALNAEGSAMRENAAYLDSIQGRIDLFNNSLQTMWMNFINDDVIKFFVDIGTQLIKLVDLINPLNVAVAGLFGGMFAKYKMKKNNTDLFSMLFETVPTKIKNSATSIFDAQMGQQASKQVANLVASGTADYTKYAQAIQTVSAAKQVEILTNNGVAESEQLLILTKTLGSEAAAKQAIYNAKLAASHATVSASMVGQLVNTGVLTTEQAAAAVSTLGLVTAEGESVVVTKAEALAKLEAAVATGVLSVADKDAIVATLGLGASNIFTTGTFVALAKSIWGAITALAKFLALTPAGWAIMAVTAITAVIAAYNKFGPTHENYIKKLEEETEELKGIQSELQSVNKELETTKDRIDELNAKDTLSFVEQEELERLERVSEELERQEKILLAQEKRARNKQAATAVKAMQTDPDTNGTDWLTIFSNAVGNTVTGSTGLTSHTIEPANDVNKYEDNLNALKIAKEDLEKAEIELANTNYDAESKEYKKLEKAVEDAEARVDKYNNTIDSINETWQTKYGEIGYIEDASTEAEKKWNEYYRQHQDYLMQQAFINGDYDKADVLGNVFGETGTDIAKGLKEQFEASVKEGNNPVKVIEELLADENLSPILDNLKNIFGITTDDIVGYFTRVGEAIATQNNVISAQSYSTLSTALENYNEILAKTSEVVFDNVEVTQEYKDSLLELGISSEELAECFDEENKLIVTNSEQLNKLVKSAKNNIAQNAKLAKSQARLKYYELYKKMRQLTNGRKVENAATLAQVNSIYKEMSALEKVIAKYSMLEHKLLGATNAYDKLAEAQAIDEATDYGSKAEELVNVLAEAFNTAELGTEAAQVAIAGLIPDEIIDKTKTLDEQMQQIYSYFTKGTMSQLFTIEFDDDGGITSVEMTKKNIEAFTESLIGSAESGAVFQGTWDEFTLNPAITSLEEFADACGLTEEVAFAFLTSLEKYDISWLGGDNTTLLDQLMGNDFEYQAYKNIEALADLEHQMANGKITAEEYATKYAELSAIQDENNKKIRENATAWASASTEVNTAKQRVEELTNEINTMRESGASEAEIQIKTTQLQQASEVLSDALKKKYALQEPTEMTLQIVLDDIQMQIDQWKADNAELVVDVVPKLVQDENGKWTIPADVQATLDESEKAKIQEYLDLANDQYTITVLADGNPNDSTSELKEVQTAAEAAQQAIENIPDPEISTTAAQTAINTLKNTVQNLINKLYEIPRDVYTTIHEETIVTTTRSGRGGVNGTAHVNGTAYKSGSWGAQTTETALVGELGPELLVRGSRWTTIGENGAEFTQVKKGDIIFNHQQTADLLSKGYVTGRGKLQGGHAFASGTAYAGINTWDDAYDRVHNDYYNGTYDGSGNDNDDIKDDAEEVVDFIEMKLEEIEAIIEKTSAKIANFLDDTTSIKSKDELYDELIKAEKDKSETYLKAAQKYNVEAAAALSGVPQQYQEMARNGAIAIEDFIGEDQVEIAEKIQEYRDWAAKADEAENGHLEAIAAISAHRVEQLEDIATDFENIISISKSHSDLLQAEMDFIEESGNRLSEDYYEELKRHAQKQLDDMQSERVALQKILDDSVAAGDVVIGSDDWYSMLETIYEVDKEIVDCKTSLEEFQNAINELYWDNFEKLIDEIDNVDSELSNLYDLISDDDKVVDEMGNWTDEGVTALGLLAQQMEVAQQKSKEYGKAIDKLKKDYAAGLYSTDEYNEKLAELTESQYDAIKSYEDAKDAIVDLNKTRIEAVKECIQKEIDAYSELIEKKKESLNSDKEAYDFQKQVEESNKNIEAIERKIAALQGDTSSSAMAQRKRLEAELLKAKEEQQDMYYDHSVEKQQEALDKELEDYTKNKEDEMDALDEYLKKEEQVISDSFDLIAENTRNIANTLIGISEEYGVSISDTVATPWINGANAIGTYEEQLNTSVSATTKNLETLKQQLEDLQTQADRTANSIVNATHSTIVETNDGHQTSIKGYAKGSKSIEYDQWALIDELGDELQLVPNGSGRLDYIKKGTGILNNTLTEKLMDLAIDPTSVLENSRPVIGAPGITTTNNTITIDNSVGTLLHVEHLDGSNPAEVAKLVDKAWEKKMQTLNNSIKKFTR